MPRITIIFSYDPFGPKVGGPETFIKGLMKYSPNDFDIEFIGTTSDSKARPLLKWGKYSLGERSFRFFPLLYEKDENIKQKFPLSLRFTWALRFSKLSFEKRILLFNRIEPAILFKKSKSPKIIVIHNDIIKQLESGSSEVFWSRFPALYHIVEKYIFNFSDFIYTVSMKTLEYYQAKYSHQKQKFAFLTTWVDSNVFHPSSELKLEIRKEILFKYDALPLNNKWLLFVGRLQEQKAPVRLLGVLGSFQRIHSDSCLIIIGEGNLRNELEEYAKKLGVQKKVFFLGSVNQNTLASFYRSADVLLLTSNFEGMPICVLESLGVGLPVVSTNVGEVGRIVKSGRSGEIIDPYSSEGFAKAIEKIINSPNIYSKHNCTAEVMEYTPEKVLGTIFARIRLFSDKD